MPSHPCENGYCETYQKTAASSNISPAIMGNNMKTPQDTKISWMWWYRPVIPTLEGRGTASEFQPSQSEIGPKVPLATSQTFPKLRAGQLAQW